MSAISNINWTITSNASVVTVNDEAALEQVLNSFTLPEQFILRVKAKGGKYTLISANGAFVSPEAQFVLDRMTGLNATEESAIISFVDREAAAGRWGTHAQSYTDAQYDAFWCFGLATEANALINWHPNFVATPAVNTNAVKQADGFSFNGTNAFIDSGFNPSVDGVNYSLNDAQAGVYSKSLTDLSGAANCLAAAFTGSINLQVQIFTNAYNGSVNCSNATSPAPYNQSSLINFVRNSSANWQTFENGALVDTRPVVSVGVPNLPVYVGARNNNSTADNFYSGVLSSFHIGGTFTDYADHYSSLLQLLIDLDVFAGPVIASFPNALAVGEEDFIREYINREVIAGRLQQLDSFSCFGLADEANALWDWVRLTSMTNNAAVKQADGFSFNGTTAFIDTGFNPSVDGVNYSLNDAQAAAFVKTNNDIATNRFLFSSDIQLELQQQPASNRLRQRLNSGNRFEDGEPYFTDNSLYTSIRETSSIIRVYKNGSILPGTSNTISSDIPNQAVVIGSDSAFSTNFNGTLSSFLIGSAVGFDQSDHYNSLVTLLTSLGVLP